MSFKKNTSFKAENKTFSLRATRARCSRTNEKLRPTSLACSLSINYRLISIFKIPIFKTIGNRDSNVRWEEAEEPTDIDSENGRDRCAFIVSVCVFCAEQTNEHIWVQQHKHPQPQPQLQPYQRQTEPNQWEIINTHKITWIMMMILIWGVIFPAFHMTKA